MEGVSAVVGGGQQEKYDRQFCQELESRAREANEFKEELNFKIKNLESANSRLKERILEKEKEINESAELFFQLKNSNSILNQTRHNEEAARLSAEKDDLEMQIKSKEASLSQCYAEAEKVKFLSNECQRTIEQTREKIDKTRSVIIRLDQVSKECDDEDRIDDENSLSEIEDERAILDSKITTLYSKLSSEQEKSNNFLYLLNQINHEVMSLSAQIEEMKKQRSDSYMKVQKTVKTAESEQDGITSNNEKMKEVSGNISYLQNELGQLQRKYEENNSTLKDLMKQYKRSVAESDRIEASLKQQQENLRAVQIANQVSNTCKKQEKQFLNSLVKRFKDIVSAFSQKQARSSLKNKCRDSVGKAEKLSKDLNGIVENPTTENVLYLVDELVSLTKGLFGEIDDAISKDGLLLDERLSLKQDAFDRLQAEISRFEEERDAMFDEIRDCYEAYILEPKRKKAKRDEANGGSAATQSSALAAADIFGGAEGREKDASKVFEAVGILMKQVEKSEAAIKNFTNVKAQFFEEFEKETQELAAKWKELEAKKNQQKTKINAERDLLYRSIEEEQMKQQKEKEKIQSEKDALRQERSKALADMQNAQSEMMKLKKLEGEFTETMREGNEQEVMNKRTLEMNVYQLKAHLSRLQASADETLAQKNIADKELQRINNFIRSQSGKLEHEREHREQSEKLERVMEENLQRMQYESEELQQINSKLNEQKTELMSEIKKFEVDMKIIIGKFEGEEAGYKQRLRELEISTQEKRRNLYLVEQVIAEKEINVARMDRLAEEFSESQEKFKELKAESLHLEHVISERKMKVEESDMTLKHLQAQITSIKSHINNLNVITAQKQSDLLNDEKRIKEIHSKVLEGELQIQKLESQQRYFVEEVTKLERLRHDFKQDVQSAEQELFELKSEVDVSSKELSKLRSTYSADERKFKSLMEENHITLQSIRENIESREVLYKDLTNKTESAAAALVSVESNLKSIIAEIQLKQASLEQFAQVTAEQEAATERITYLNDLQAQLEKQLENVQSFLQENHAEANNLEAYIEELKDEAKEILNRIKALNEAEDSYNIKMSLQGDPLTESIVQRVNHIMGVYQASVNQDNEHEDLLQQLNILQEENEHLKQSLSEYSAVAVGAAPAQVQRQDSRHSHRSNHTNENQAQNKIYQPTAALQERVAEKKHEEKRMLEVPSTQEYPGGLCFSLGPPAPALVTVGTVQNNTQPSSQYHYLSGLTAAGTGNGISSQNQNHFIVSNNNNNINNNNKYPRQQQLANPFISKITNSQTDEDQNLEDKLLFASNQMSSQENTHDFNDQQHDQIHTEDREFESEQEQQQQMSNQSFEDAENNFQDVPNLLHSSSFSHDTS